MLGITAYCDESYDEVGTGVFVTAGYVATLGQWLDLSSHWQRALADEGLEEFKASNCEQGRKQFEGWPRERRRECCKRFILLIRGAQLTGAASVIDLHAYNQHRPEIESLRTHRTGQGNNVIKFGDPYYVGFQHLTEMLATKVQKQAPQEKIMFLFDITTEHKEKALQVFNGMMNDKTNAFYERLQTASFADSRTYAGLQAADLVAFEVRRHFEGPAYGRTKEGVRWQWPMLTERPNVSLTIEHFTAESVPALMEQFRTQWGQ
jgi:hypothetical protein